MNKKHNLFKKILSIVLAINLIIGNVCFDGIFPFTGMFHTTLKAEAAYTPTLSEDDSTFVAGLNGEISINSISVLKDYAFHYYESETFADNHEDDILRLVLGATDTTIDSEYIPIGTSTHPFNGSLLFSTTNNTFDLKSQITLFDYITDDAIIGGAVTLNLTNQTEDHVLLANNVISGTHTAEWNLILDSASVSYAGVIGKMLENSEVKLNFTDNSSVSVSNSAGDTGIVCDTMESNSKIVLSLTKSNSSFDVSSSSGNAGALVGTMNSGSVLELVRIPATSSSSTISVSGSGYAGGLVGWGRDASVSIASTGMTVGDVAGETVIPIQGSVNASTGGAGGLFGYYENTVTGTFDLKDYNITAAVYAQNCGGVFGVLENNKGESTAVDLTIINTGAVGTVDTSSSDESNYAESGYFGGIAGKYVTDGLDNSLVLDGFSVTSTANADFDSFGGVIGCVDPSSAAYIKADNLTVNSINPGRKDSSAFYGGLIGKTSDNYGVFVDLGDFNLTASNFKGGGIVGNFKNGVLRLSGTTDLSSSNSVKGGLLVGENNNVLAYALGNGSDYTAAVTDPDSGEVITSASGWTIKRSNGSQVDDLGTWGEVVRMVNDGSGDKNLEQAGILAMGTGTDLHKVTLAASVPENMSNTSEFTKTALNIMLNKNDGYGLFIFDSESASSTLLSGTLSIDTNISLVGTGINGFMCDGGEIDAVGSFIGTLSGGNNTITLAIGEKYGKDSTDAIVTSSSTGDGLGQIYRHPYNGLFAVIGDGADSTGTVNSLTVNGSIDVVNKSDVMNIGGIAAISKGGTSINDVSVSQIINYSEPTVVSGEESRGKNIGGMIGLASGSSNGSENGTIAISGNSIINADINISGNYKSWTCVGAAIGKITSSNFTVNIAQDTSDKLTISHTMNVADGTSMGDNSDGGGLIGYITSGTYSNRKVNINNLEFDGCTIVNKANKNGGGFLGYAWIDTETTIEGLVVKDGTITNSSPNVGVMCYEATGKWIVNDLIVTKMSLSGGAGTSLGMLVNKAYSGEKGLYLDVLNSHYNLTDKAGGTGITLPDSIGIYDELAAYSASDVLSGGNGTGIVSINMNSDRNGTSVKITETGTYQNQLTSASSSSITSDKYANEKSRYYYNLDKMSNDNEGQNLVLWSVNKYAASNIAGEFKKTENHSFGTTLDKTLSGTANLAGLSFYPLKKASNYTLNDLKITFDYSGIYSTAENVSDSDDFIRDPGVTLKNQHFLMHSGLFIDNPAGNTITISGNSSIGGNFLEVDRYKAALISGTMNGNLKVTGETSSLKLIGLTPKTTGGVAYTDGYLLVNNISRPDNQTQTITMELNNVSTSGYSKTAQTAVAKSLIGPSDGRSLTFKFSGIKLDSRKTTVPDTTVSGVNSTLTDTYGTSRSIFSDSTLVYSINTDQYAELIYNYTRDEDWGSDGSGDRVVTYGAEITSSKEYAGQERKYYGDPRNFTRPDSDSNSEYTFSDSIFLPYVSIAYNPEAVHTGKYYREIKVNVVTEVTWEGCGTYNDPYIISDPSQLETISKFLQSGNTDDIGSIILPIYDSTKFGGIDKNISGNRWCTDKTGNTYHVSYNNNGTTGFTATNQNPWPASDAQYYLAGAYYKITANIELGDNFMGLGGTTANTAFRGVIVGEKDEFGAPRYTITNKTDKPFIWVTNGCVIKDINIKVNSNVTISQANNSYTAAYFGYDYQTDVNACKFYGGMIGEIMGGDNIVDNSYVIFESGRKITLDGNNGTLVPVGAYTGAVVYGGLIFKNIDARKATLSEIGLKVYYKKNTANLAEDSANAKAAIYVNPLVGRVVNGYAVNETGGNAKDATGTSVQQFSVTEDGTYHDDENTSRSGKQHTLKNGTKHYSIADIDPTLAKLDVTAVPADTLTDGNINVPNAQALFVLSLITQSTAGTAETVNALSIGTDETIETSRETDENGNLTIYNTRNIVNSGTLKEYSNSLSYGTYSSSVYGMSHVATYNDVGTNEASCDDYSNLVSSDTAASSALPYIIRHYTEGGFDTTTTTTTTTKTDEASAEGRIEVFEGGLNDLDGKTLYITADSGNDTYSLKSSEKAVSGQNLKNGLEALKANKGTVASGASKILVTKINEGTNVGKFTIKDISTNKYVSFKNNNRNLYMDNNPYYFTIESAGNNKWYIKGSFGANPYLALRNNDHFCGQGTDSIVFYQYFDAITTTTTTITTTNTTTTAISYPARCVTSSAGNYDINLTGSGIYQLPDSFRGLGCVGNYNANYCMKVDQFAGSDLTIDEDIYLNKYQTDNYFNRLHNGTTQSTSANTVDYDVGIAGGNNHGIGLFDSIITKGSDSNITSFTLSGSVNTEIYSNSYTASPKELSLPAANDARFLSVGGVCGTALSGNNLNFSQIDLINFTANGSSLVGGILGYSAINQDSSAEIHITKCGATDLSVIMTSSSLKESQEKARNAIGGFVGKCYEGKVKIYGTLSGADNEDIDDFSTVTFKTFKFENASADYRTAAGGLVGFAGDGCQVYDMKVMSGNSGDSVLIGGDGIRFVGGICGLMQSAKDGTNKENQPYTPTCYAVFKNCIVENINFKGQFVGGFYGGKWGTTGWTTYSIDIDNCEVRGNSEGNNTIEAVTVYDKELQYAGGFVGRGLVLENGTPNIRIKDSLVSNYTITGTYCGGFIGYTGSYKSNSSITCYIHDSSVEDCVIGAGNNYAGGAIGQVNRNSSSSTNRILGYNIKLDHVTSNSSNMGAWIGYVDSGDNTTSIQFTGVGIYGNGFTKNVGNRSNFSNASFVFADYDGICESYDTTNNFVSSLNCSDHSSTSSSHVEMPKYPYVNINPQSGFGSTQIISGDGAVLIGDGVNGYTSYSSANTMAAKLYADIEQGTDSRRYTTFSDDTIANGNYIKHYLQQNIAGAGDRISTWETEMGEMPSNDVDDFAMIVIANEEASETTALLNRYIQLVTNTSTDYSKTSEYYTVVPLACVYNSATGNFETTSDTPSISYNPSATSTNAFTVNRAGADSLAINKFTLLDVQFMDPLHTDKVAYHLYVPVYVKRSISATFSSTALSGTTALSTDYTGYLAQTTNHRLIENLDNWITVYIRYKYSMDDINAVLSSGMLDWNSSKEVNLAFGTNATGRTLPNDTQLVLIDPNGDIDRAYYAKGSDLTDKASSATEFQFSLSDFNKKYDGSGDDFTEQFFSKILDSDCITATDLSGTENEGTGYYNRVPAADADDNTIKIGDYFYSYVSDKTGQYDLAAADAFSEDYYISMLVPSDENEYIYLFDVLAPDTLEGKMTTIISRPNQPHAEVLLGDLFQQTFATFDASSVNPQNEVINESDHTITVNVTSTVKLKAAEANIREYYAAYLGTTPLYHADVVTFTRHDANGSDMTINGGTSITSSGTVDDTPVSTEASLVGSYVTVKTGDIRNQVIQGANQENYDGATITQTINVTFLGYEDEFPARPSDQELYGVNPSVSSNISYDENGLTFSGKKISHIFDKRYYVEKANTATIKYEADDVRDNYDSVGFSSFNNSRLGNNGLDRSYTCAYPDDGMPINATAVYNASMVANYDSAETIVYTLTLFKKTDVVENGVVKKVSYEQVDIAEYLKNVKIFGGKRGITELTKTSASNNQQYVYSELVEDANEDAKMFTIGTYFEVVTGGEFQDYANYRVVLETHLLTENGAAISNSVVKDYIVYTNAKIWPEVIQQNEP